MLEIKTFVSRCLLLNLSYAKAAGQSRLVNLLQRFVNSQDADGPMEDSFDDDDDEFDGHQNPIGGAAANPLGLPLEPSAQVPLPLAKVSTLAQKHIALYANIPMSLRALLLEPPFDLMPKVCPSVI